MSVKIPNIDLREFDSELEDVVNFLDQVRTFKSENTYTNRRVSLRQYRQFLDSNKAIRDTNQSEIKNWIKQLIKEDTAPRTIRQKIFSLSSYIIYLHEEESVDYRLEDEDEDNPFRQLDIVKELGETKVGAHGRDTLSKQDYRAMLNVANQRDSLILRLMWETGIRNEELTRVREEHVNMEERSIDIVEGKQNALSLQSETRPVFFSMKTRRLLKDWRDRGGRAAYPHASESDYLFVSKEAPSLSTESVQEVVKTVAERADVQEVAYEDKNGNPRYEVHPHLFRRTFCTRMLRNGCNLAYLSELTGDTMEVLKESYISIEREDLRDAADSALRHLSD